MYIDKVCPTCFKGKSITLREAGMPEYRAIPNNTVKFTDFFGSKIQYQNEDEIALKCGNDAIGVMHYIMTDSRFIISENELPADWIKYTSDGKQVSKKFAYLQLLTINADKRNQGLAREAIKRLYFESCNRGGEGRILCHSAWNSYDFYGKLGFEALQTRINNSLKMLNSIFNINVAPKISRKEIENNSILNLLKVYMPEFKDKIEKIMKKLPYQDDIIIFNPKPENVAKLFVSKHI